MKPNRRPVCEANALAKLGIYRLRKCDQYFQELDVDRRAGVELPEALKEYITLKMIPQITLLKSRAAVSKTFDLEFFHC